MPFRFIRSDGTAEAGVRRIACEQIDEALAAIRSGELEPERVVHEVRKRCKALRALIRLVRPAFPAYARENAAIRDIARLLRRSRDGKVLADTFDALTAEPDDALDPRALRLLRKRLAQRTDKGRPLRQSLGDCEERLVALRVRAAGWLLTAHGWDALAEGLAKTLGAARRHMKRARTGDPAASHEWRKHVKHHWHQLRLLCAVAPDAVGRRAKRTARLGDMLGDRHDLDLLVAALAAQPRRDSDTAMIALLGARAAKRAAKLEHKAARLGERLFAPGRRRLVTQWGEAWRERVGEAATA